jgi:hypothetical protein
VIIDEPLGEVGPSAGVKDCSGHSTRAGYSWMRGHHWTV